MPGITAEAIHDAWIRRQLIDMGEVTVNRAFGSEPELNGIAQIEAAEQTLFDLATRGGAEGGLITFEKALTMAIEIAATAHKQSGIGFRVGYWA